MSCPSIYIAFEGPIGAGKTSLARRMAEELEAHLFLEEFDGNDFLPDFYSDNERWALPMQLWFLVNRVNHVRTSREVTAKWIVSDYSFAKEAILAETLVTIDREFELYRSIASALQETVQNPHVIVWLDADNETLLSRIRRRGRPYEAAIDHRYLDQLREAYREAFARRTDIKIIPYDTRALRLDSHVDIANLRKLICEEVLTTM